MAKWRNLSTCPETIEKIPNLMWTEIAANVLVGTKSIISAFPSAPVYQVQSNRRRIFFNYAWAFPGIICMAIWVFRAVLSLAIYLFPGPHSLARLSALRDLINRLSVGRPLVSAYHQSSPTNGYLSTKEWVSTAGQRTIDLYPATSVPGDLEAEMDILIPTKVTGQAKGRTEQSLTMVSKRRASV